eukprot:TRINITY_DN5132_c0_g2_i3.p1 TRINITY_DN5132_c0_g2~~TRINITY_DN5132_c0_g2_i3.p1  ORF type:complete len:487 (-),score=96.19 TRINITY_DN5132_c0_g2_i3:77-1537(-)
MAAVSLGCDLPGHRNAKRPRSRSRSCTSTRASSGAASQNGSSCSSRSSDGAISWERKHQDPLAPEGIAFGPDGYDFTAPEAIPLSARERVRDLLECGRLFRYQGGANDVAELERDFAEYVGLPYAVACNSGGCGLFLALKAIGVKQGDKVLLNAWTLSPVPGAVVHANATPVFVKTDQDTLSIDLEDLEKKTIESGAKVLLLSYMRGHVPNMDRTMAVVRRLGLLLVEDCAHTLGAKWKLEGDEEHRHLGSLGDVGVWSLQTNKCINSGEGGIIATKRQDVASIVTISTGSYGHFALNGASGDTKNLQDIYPTVPNMSMRMTNLAAALARPQLDLLPYRLEAWERHALIVRKALKSCPHVRVLDQSGYYSGKEAIVWSSIQFEIVGFTEAMIEEVRSKLEHRGIPLAWFGGKWRGFTSTLKDWKFADPSGEQWKQSNAVALQKLLDLPLYHTTSWPDAVFDKLATLIIDSVTEVAASVACRQAMEN